LKFKIESKVKQRELKSKNFKHVTVKSNERIFRRIVLMIRCILRSYFFSYRNYELSTHSVCSKRWTSKDKKFCFVLSVAERLLCLQMNTDGQVQKCIFEVLHREATNVVVVRRS